MIFATFQRPSPTPIRIGIATVDAFPIGSLLAPKLTLGSGGRTASYTPRDWGRIVRHGVLTDGHPAVMPSEDFQLMSDQELSDIVAYIRTLPAVENTVPPPTFGPVGTILVATVKYELDKQSGLRKLDRPQRFSNVCPSLYGLIPQTFCGSHVAALAAERTGRLALEGDADPLDICVLAERPIPHGDILLQAIPIGRLRMIDGDEADDKIIAVLFEDPAYGAYRDITDCAPPMVTRLVHYFETYKQAPGAVERPCEVTDVYGRAEACDVIRRSQIDYHERFGALESLLEAALHG